MKANYTPVWQKKIQHAERIIEGMATRAREHHVPFIIVLIPQRIQALLVKNPHEARGMDPFAFSHQIKSIGNRHGVPVFDFLERLANYTDPASLYYPVDGHLTPTGQRLLGQFVAEELSSAGILPKTYR